VIGIYGSGKGYDRQGRRDGQIHPIPEKRYTQQQCDEAMGIGWMRMEALSQAVPPAYSQYIAEHFLRTLAVSDGPRPQAGKAAVTFRWPGGKAGLAPLIISHAPRSGRKFIDLFGGRGNVTFRAWFENLQFEQWILNDPLTTPFFRALRDYQNVERMVVPPRTREEFDRQAALAARGDQRALLLEPWLAFNGGLYSSGGFSTTGSRRSPESYKANLIAGHHVIVEKKPRITSLDWFDCLEAEELDERDFVMVDPSYVSGCVSPYTADSVVHCELIDVLKSAPFRWVMTEYLEPLYVAAFGEPIATKEVRNKAISSRVTGGQERRVECIWTGEGKKSAPPNVPKRFNETLPPSASLTIEQLLAATKDVVAEITSLANRRSAAHREKLLPLLIELKKRLPKGQFYSTLKKMGLTPSTVRVWHHRGRAADEIIDMLEEKPKKNKFRGSRDGSRDRDSNEEDAADLAARFLLQADKAIAALLRGDIDKAKRLGREYAEARQIQKGSDAHREVRKIA
jgi:site-specific DNA-adenine methylase